jgi:peptidoglycan/xylan/chitin deacetylase (PgdA/CDA1 family)
MKQNNKILLSFDVEEFDLPLEYKREISPEEQLETGYKGFLEIKELASLVNHRSTFFTTAFFAENFPNDLKELSLSHEIASHSYFHSSFKAADIKNSKEKLEAITGKPVYGFRMPLLKAVDPQLIADAGYQYNSGINPTWIPGRYNNWRYPRKFFKENKLVQFPVSVTPHFRIPLFWLAFKNMPYSFFLKLALQTLRHDGYLCLYFHPWEFTDLSKYKLPFYLKRGSNEKLLQKLTKLIGHLSGEGEFTTMHQFLNEVYTD